MLEGKGKLYFENGTVYEGTWKNDNLHFLRKRTDKDGNVTTY